MVKLLLVMVHRRKKAHINFAIQGFKSMMKFLNFYSKFYLVASDLVEVICSPDLVMSRQVTS